MRCKSDPTADEILARRISLHRSRGEHGLADMLAASRGADPRPSGAIGFVRRPLQSGRKLTAANRKRIIEMLAAGQSQRRIAARCGFCRWTVWSTFRRLKAEIRSMLAGGATADQIRRTIGEEGWTVWQRSQQKAEKPKRRR